MSTDIQSQFDTEDLRQQFESMANDPTYKFRRSRRGMYVNPAVSRDWKWFQSGAVQRALAPTRQAAPGPKYLCKAWGETDLPSVAVVQSLDEVRKFLVAEWLGDDGDDADSAMQSMRSYWEIEGECCWSVEFEIGGILVQKVNLAMLAAAPQPEVQGLITRNGELVDMIERLCNGLENYRNTAPWGDDDEDVLTEAREMAAGLDVPFEIHQHFDDAAIDKFSAALKAKMAEGRAKGRQGWETCPPPELSNMLRNHVEKGDPRDVALYCMMHWHKEAAIAVPSPSKRVYLVATGETWGGLETYTRHEAPIPLADQEMLLAAVPSVPSWAQISSEQIPSWPHESLVRFARAANNEMIRLCAWIREFNDGKPSKIQLADDTMRAIRTRALDEFGTGQAQGELWDQILMRETARTIQAAAKGGA